jgi:hypothetical protein
MAAPVGNQNARKAKDWENALRRILAQYESEKVPRGEALAKIAEQCVLQALEGDRDARNEIANRLDGKHKQPIVGGDEDDNPISVLQKVERVLVRSNPKD